MQADSPKADPDPCVLVLFGASGDLVSRKIIPSLAELHASGALPHQFAVIGVSRTAMSDDDFRDHLLAEFRSNNGGEPEGWRDFAPRVHYVIGDASKPDVYNALKRKITAVAERFDIVMDEFKGEPCDEAPYLGCPNLLLYLSVAPFLYGPIIEQIGHAGLVFSGGGRYGETKPDAPWQRVIIEKPIGNDLDSALQLNRTVAKVFDERAVYRIDHYLGKELVQNILVVRFANAMFEPVWSNQYVDHVQVTATETVGVGKRAGGFYDRAGAIRDMLQSHLLQVMSIVAMEAPSEYSPDAIRREKVKVLDATHAVDPKQRDDQVVLGRYGASGDDSDDDQGLAYTQLDGVDPDKKTETFAAIRLAVDNWRWNGVPFYIRSGKKMARKLTEVVVQFKRPPANLFRHFEPFSSGGWRPGNRIIMNIAPDEGIGLRFEAKIPGTALRIGSVKADFDYKHVFKSEPAEAYGPLLVDAMRGDKTLFKHRDEVEGAWRIVDPVVRLEAADRTIHEYRTGSWGPDQADELFQNRRADDTDRRWHNPTPTDVR
jgi:glucose-6-phosphate 1-dehydrogenase